VATKEASAWLSPEVLRWRTQEIGWSPATSQLGRLAIEEWDHGSLRLNPPCQGSSGRKEDRKDAIAAFWRAVERRIQLFDEVYKARKVLGLNSREPFNLRHLEDLGLVRGSILNDIRKLRNDIQHSVRLQRGTGLTRESVEPPPRTQCLLYQDAVWYFLRSTERFAQRIPAEYTLVQEGGNEDEQLVSIQMEPPDWTVRISIQQLPDHLISQTPVELWIPIKIDTSDFHELSFIAVRGIVVTAGSIDDPAWMRELAKIYFAMI
jgi:hypothetical protein